MGLLFVFLENMIFKVPLLLQVILLVFSSATLVAKMVNLHSPYSDTDFMSVNSALC